MAEDVAVLGVGMHPWGKWGRNFVEYGVKAARDALKDAGVAWTDIQFVAGGDTVRNGYPGYVAGATFAEAMGWTGAQVASNYGACATGAQAINTARAQILAGLCDVALVVGADTAPKGFFAPTGGARTDDPRGEGARAARPPGCETRRHRVHGGGVCARAARRGGHGRRRADGERLPRARNARTLRRADA